MVIQKVPRFEKKVPRFEKKEAGFAQNPPPFFSKVAAVENYFTFSHSK
jgi:hypothetical protein